MTAKRLLMLWVIAVAMFVIPESIILKFAGYISIKALIWISFIPFVWNIFNQDT